MEEYRKKLERKFRLFTAFCTSSMILFFILKYTTKNVPDFAQGLLTGILTGMELVSVFVVARLFTILNNDEKLKEEYIKDNDERNMSIQKETAKTASIITLMLTALAAILAGFFNPVVSMTLAVDIIAGAVITVLVKSYYNKKM